MMKILSTQEIKEADAYTIEHDPVSSVDLMERAAEACFQWIKNRFDKGNSFNVFCGTGNNGGDGLAMARKLIESGYRVDVFIIYYSDHQSQDFQTNKQRLIEIDSKLIHAIKAEGDVPVLEKGSIVIDAIFGTGLKMPVDGLVAACIRWINKSYTNVVAIDIPSGLFSDVPMDPKNEAVKATYTLAFQVPKLAFMFGENFACVGDWIVLDIGLNEKFIEQLPSNRFIMDRRMARDILQPRQKFANKGHFGHAFLIAGSYGKLGAAILASKACLKSGTGLLTVHVPRCGFGVLQSCVPEAMVQTDTDEHLFTDKLATEKISAIGIGCGIGTDERTVTALKYLLTSTKLPIVLDADAINILALNKLFLELLPANAIITPHPKEFERLTGKAKNDFHRLEMQVELAVKHNLFIVLKGAHTSIACPDGSVYFNNTGNPGMAKGGSGDALTGILLGLLAQQYTPKAACLLGVYLHGLAGDLAAKKRSMHAMVASDLIDSLGDGFKEIDQISL